MRRRRRRTRVQRTDNRCHVCGAAKNTRRRKETHARSRIFNKHRDGGGARERAERALDVYDCRCATTRTAGRDWCGARYVRGGGYGRAACRGDCSPHRAARRYVSIVAPPPRPIGCRDVTAAGRPPPGEPYFYATAAHA